MNYEELLEKIKRLEYHQTLLAQMVSTNKFGFYQLVIEKSLHKNEVEDFYKLCEKMHIKLEEQKAEGFVYFHPLLEEFKSNLHPNLQAEEVVEVCLNQHLFVPLMLEFKKYL
ncbi:DUF1878 family protein [Bacillus sp. 31A1R]|uniref:DUF1878 family protein n=1 Tax=Robertmurraya mangrovi TaxID=3098077 RepID=A0ABU5ISR9_9BACI|nr:DUF1878 family protein [Bacillus sp. 31A1R]MDZ5470203.1 DUF1878 family protein [Bacillus sp. 31A1R]